ncbi:MAG: 50S ribosomal protein L19 [Bdellovibrionales bacterium]|nr:50S ribosomal protein L19 [Bdellovibrionales bacterium]
MANLTTDLIRRVTTDRHPERSFPQFSSGDTLAVHLRIKEGEKERVQVFQGVVIKIQGSGIGRSFTVRKMSSGVGVERTIPLYSPAIDKIELLSRGSVRRGRLFYLRALRGRAARLTSELVIGEERTGRTEETSDTKASE